MPAVLVDVATAILKDLNANPKTNFGVKFIAVRSYAEWDVALEGSGLDELHVDVVPAGQPINTLADRGGNIEYETVIHIGIRQRFRRGGETKRFDLSEIDPLVLLTERIADYFASDGGVPHQLSTMNSATWKPEGTGNESSGILQPVDKTMLRMHGQFTGIVQLIYEVIRTPAI